MPNPYACIPLDCIDHFCSEYETNPDTGEIRFTAPKTKGSPYPDYDEEASKTAGLLGRICDRVYPVGKSKALGEFGEDYDDFSDWDDTPDDPEYRKNGVGRDTQTDGQRVGKDQNKRAASGNGSEPTGNRGFMANESIQQSEQDWNRRSNVTNKRFAGESEPPLKKLNQRLPDIQELPESDTGWWNSTDPLIDENGTQQWSEKRQGLSGLQDANMQSDADSNMNYESFGSMQTNNDNNEDVEMMDFEESDLSENVRQPQAREATTATKASTLSSVTTNPEANSRMFPTQRDQRNQNEWLLNSNRPEDQQLLNNRTNRSKASRDPRLMRGPRSAMWKTFGNEPGTTSPSANLFYNLKNASAYSGMDLAKFKRRNKTISMHKPYKSRFRRNPIIATGLYTCLFADTCEWFANDVEINNGYRYILVVVDGLSRQSFVRPLKRKTAEETAAALEDIIKRLDLPGHTFLMVDDGNEFKGAVLPLLEKWQITPHQLRGRHKSSIAERFMHMTENFGNLLFYNRDVRCDDDPYKGYKVLSRAGQFDCGNRVLFEVPDDKFSLKLSECMFRFRLSMPENYVPDNDVHGKLVRKLDIKILDNRIFSSFDDHEHAFFSQAITKLNYSPLAQDCELFPYGRFDSLEADSYELEYIKLARNNKTLAENRKQYGQKRWETHSEAVVFKTGDQPQKYERCFYDYDFRAPITHGLARQPRVLPPGSRPSLEVTLNYISRVLMELSEFQLCRVSEDAVSNMEWPFPTGMKTVGEPMEHKTAEDCDCTAAKYDSGEYTDLEQVYKAGEAKYTDKSLLYQKTKINSGDAEAPWKAHTLKVTTPIISPCPEDDKKKYIWMKHTLDPEDIVDPKNYIMESVFCEPGKSEKPVSTGVKGEGVLPFFYPRMTRKSLSGNLSTYDIEVNTGPLPKMIVLTGMPHSRYEIKSFRQCLTKTTMADPDFKIKQLTVFVNNVPQFRSPWTTATDHYTNFMKHNGRWDNKANALGQDFFVFRDYFWMVPLFFDDREGNTANVTIRIEFETPLEATWDTLIFRIPRNELFLDANRNEATVLEKNASGKKRKSAELKALEEKCTKDTKVDSTTRGVNKGNSKRRKG
ncbi:Oidioi.mRNA.OKI2018_I69.chr1.g1462.t2.cds [Oikopleura dioica]|uniref:Oidioi.mRNA.OKI2018_I69.chr1.g1462.t2.cds n=1 Tax=Oikopleura dioica TaxID=34765 RepID=A0ABN7SNI2_OIKDI|nr:Oidioi.mRNA.OKI2018_I69.chr1.g1462.t2.cds [Oikopleura dioica]